MISVTQQPEITDFDSVVRQPGLTSLRNAGLDPSLVHGDHNFKDYWNHDSVKEAFRDTYSRTCAYFGIYISRNTGAYSVDHYLPKSLHPAYLAYEWDNYRLACSRVNSRKGTKTVLDPFIVQDNWFQLELASGLLRLHKENIPDTYRGIASFTISPSGLDLNSDDLCTERSEYWNVFTANEITAAYLATHCPIVFIHTRMQGRIE